MTGPARCRLRASACLLGLILSGCGASNPSQQTLSFTTWHGSGPDKWASVWLASRHLSPGVPVRIVPVNEPLDPASVPFDVPGARLARTAESTTYEKLLAEFGLQGDTVQALGGIVRDIEVNFWGMAQDPRSASVEQAFRKLQRSNPDMPAGCVLQFFDALYAQLAEGPGFEVDELAPSSDCPLRNQLGEREVIVPEIPIDSLLHAMNVGQSVTFVDVREPAEFQENHIPGALNLLIRNVDEHSVSLLPRSDLYIAYCVKDFRGFEMARLLREHGLDARIVNPFGLKGWMQHGLPTVTDQHSEDVALADLEQCVNDPGRCRS